MGDRISIQFKNGKEKSVVLFSHWGGLSFFEVAKKYTLDLINEIGLKEMTPLDRLEPNTVMVDFIRYVTEDEKRIESNLYLGATEFDGDNSDNGHKIIDLIIMKMEK